MSFPRYPEYKNSGTEWLGVVPKHWGVVKIRWLCKVKKRIVGELGFDVLSITQKGIRVKDTESNDGQLSMDYSKYQLVEAGDFAMNHMDLLTGYVDISQVVGVTSPDYRVFSVRDSGVSHAEYLLYLFQNGYINKIFYPYGQGSSQLGRWRLPTEQFNDFWFPLPPKNEQVAIASFLVRETAKIDALVAEQEKLMALLKEKRQAVISHAVTKGLDPAVPMKDSGVEWLGEVPVHWHTKRLRLVASLNPSKSETGDFDSDTEVSFLPMESIGDDGKIELNRVRRIHELLAGYTYFREGDVTIAKITPCFENGKGAVMCGLRNGIGFGTTELIVLRPIAKETTSDYLQWIFTSSVFRKLGEGEMYGAGGQKRVPDEFVREFRIAFPELQEQIFIVNFLKEETRRFDELFRQSELVISLLKERRSALISAAVTGKIDVRGLKKAKAA